MVPKEQKILVNKVPHRIYRTSSGFAPPTPISGKSVSRIKSIMNMTKCALHAGDDSGSMTASAVAEASGPRSTWLTGPGKEHIHVRASILGREGMVANLGVAQRVV